MGELEWAGRGRHDLILAAIDNFWHPGPSVRFFLGFMVYKSAEGGSPEPWILVYGGRAGAWRRELEWAGPGRSGYRPDGGSGDGRGIFSLPIVVASHGAGSEFPTADGSVNVPPQTVY